MINSFDGQFRFLSNYYISFCPISDEFGLKYNSVEAAYQASKTLNREERQIFTTCDPSTAKKLGKKATLRHDWDEVKLEVMENFLRQKFSHPTLKQKLIDTGNEELVEGNWWNDTFWGVCNGEGQNHLGKLLMKIRKEIS